MFCSIQCLADTGDIRCNTRSSFILGSKYRLDFMFLVSSENLCIFLDRYTFTPFDFQCLNVQAPALAEVNPEIGKMTESGHQYLVTRIQRIGNG
ncbi:hypothetical protein D3C83_50770 [compost metagenome]